MTHISGFERSQLLLLPEAIDDYVVADNPVRFIDAFVDGLDLAAAGFKRVTPKVTGRPGYAPGDLLKLYIYGYLNRVRSSRRLEAECHRNIEVIWLLRTLKPDFKTIADFRERQSQPPSAPCSASSRCCAGNSIFSGASCWRWMARASRRSTTRTATSRRTRWRSSSRRWTSVWTNICERLDESDVDGSREQAARAPKTSRKRSRRCARSAVATRRCWRNWSGAARARYR